MMEPIASTAEILAFKVLNRNIDQAWVNWAVDMLRAGFDTEHLVILAGESEPFNSFEMDHLVEKVLKELKIDYSNRDKIIQNYVCFLIDKVILGERENYNVLRTLMDLYYELDIRKDLQDFALLNWAKQDLNYGETQFYWPNATRENIDQVIMDYFLQWKKEHCTG